MKKLLLFGIVVGITATLFSACTPMQPAAEVQQPAGGQAQKVGETTKTGKISKLGTKYYLEEAGAKTIEVDSYGLDLSAYTGQTVTATGQYSGDTLFIGKIE